MSDKTRIVDVRNENNLAMRQTLQAVYAALEERGYDPLGQISGYILSEDPTYITTHKNARALAQKLDRDELLGAMLRGYLGLS
ncbi:MAG: IreB family regulatory phosphoprotein [Oscillospiraceae bacterium]|nr:IreB family regulatory phosphoprotein [Oscillospiraceae bacterium]